MRVVVADDVMLTREGIVRLLEEAGIEVAAQAEDAEGLLREVRLKRPDVAIADIRMPPSHTDEGLVAAQRIRAEHPEVGVLVLSQYVEPSYAMLLLEEHPEGVGYQQRSGRSRGECRSFARADRGQATICISRVVLLRRRPPSSVTVTMSSMRTPKRSGR
jgi:DNA-binding NarL/FixJ family response regulator